MAHYYNNKNKLFISNYFDSLEKEIEAEYEHFILTNRVNNSNKSKEDILISELLTRKKDKLLNKIHKTKLLNLREFQIKCDKNKLLKYEHDEDINYYDDDLNDEINKLLFPHFCFHIKNKWLKEIEMNRNVMLGYLILCDCYLNQNEMKLFEKLLQSHPIENQCLVLNRNILTIMNIINTIRENNSEELIQMNYDFRHELIDLNFDKMSLISIDEKVFKNCTNLKALSIEHNKLTQIDSGIFGNDLNKNLSELYIGFNSIEKIDTFSFHNLANLKILYLNNNCLEKLQSNLFDGLDRLCELNLSNNKIKTIESGVFDHLLKLEKLSLNCNKLDKIQSNYFSKLTQLKELNLSSNLIDQIDAFSFLNLYSLTVLDLSLNRLHYLNESLFEGLSSSLEELYLYKNPLNEIEEDGLFFQKMLNLNVCFI